MTDLPPQTRRAVGVAVLATDGPPKGTEMMNQSYPEGLPELAGQRRARAINEHWDDIARAMTPTPVNDYTCGTFEVYTPEFATSDESTIPLGNCPTCWPRYSVVALDHETGSACACARGCEPDAIELALLAVDERTRAGIAELSRRVAS